MNAVTTLPSLPSIAACLHELNSEGLVRQAMRRTEVNVRTSWRMFKMNKILIPNVSDVRCPIDGFELQNSHEVYSSCERNEAFNRSYLWAGGCSRETHHRERGYLIASASWTVVHSLARPHCTALPK